MAHTWGQDEALLSINKVKKQRKKQAKQEAEIQQQLEECRKAVQKAEQKLSAAQARLEADKTYLNDINAKLEKFHQQPRLAEQVTPKKIPDVSPQDASPGISENHATTSTQADTSTPSPQAEAPLDNAHAQENAAPLPQSGLYAYALVNANPEHLDLVGIDRQHKIFPVQRNSISVMVSEIDIEQFQNQVKRLFSELATTAGAAEGGPANILQAHEYVIDTLMQDMAVVPLKFGTILKDTSAAMQLLQDQEEHFKDLLTKFSGKEEWGVKVYVDRQALMTHITHTEPRFATQQEQNGHISRGRAYLIERKKAEELKNYVDAQLAQASETIFQTFEKDSFEAKANTTLSQKTTGRKKDMILNAVYLIEKERINDFRQQEKSFIDSYSFMNLDIEFSGPWPPYNFT